MLKLTVVKINSNNLFLSVLSRTLAIQDGCCAPVTPPPSCLCDASVLLAAILRYTQDSTAAASMKIEALVQVWANLVADWNAWEEDEDESVFDSIEEAVALQVRSNLFCMYFMAWFKKLLHIRYEENHLKVTCPSYNSSSIQWRIVNEPISNSSSCRFFCTRHFLGLTTYFVFYQSKITY